jgi:hypothetical protein
MKIISHRRNTITQLNETPCQYGVEVDIRSQGDSLIIHHDPFVCGEPFETWLQAYRHGTLILNVKEEGLEPRLIDLMRRACVEDYFFLDQSFPFLIKYAQLGERRCAVRVSQFESIETVLTLAGKVQWVWVDYFTRFPLTGEDAKRLQKAGFKLCLVSPELQGHVEETELPKLFQLLRSRDIHAEAVCTKRPDLWGQFVPR